MIVNTSTRAVISETEFRALFPKISFPSIIADEDILEYGYATIVITQPPTVPITHVATDVGPVKGEDGKWISGWSVRPKSQEELAAVAHAVRASLTNTIQGRLDKFAQDHGYDNILSLCTYATSSVERFRREGQRGVDLRDQTWAVADQIAKDVNAGKRAMPMSFEEIKSEFPALEM